MERKVLPLLERRGTTEESALVFKRVKTSFKSIVDLSPLDMIFAKVHRFCGTKYRLKYEPKKEGRKGEAKRIEVSKDM